MTNLVQIKENQREPCADLIDILERALVRAKAGEIVAGAGCFIGDAFDDPHTHWNVLGTYDQAYTAAGMLNAEIYDIASRTANRDVDG